MPNQPKTPNRPIRIPDGIWVSAQEIAARAETDSAVVHADLTRYVRRRWRLLSADTRAWVKREFPPSTTKSPAGESRRDRARSPRGGGRRRRPGTDKAHK
ncbi:hypothetical protein [Actinopolymorpha pittospori]|uniref:Uncharacterized protein n=1 Tax=Actinopolymorpha pittospori TaxID=648752 RepID=A0A927MP66_9ACTN|nr:hypothetical protein [Actinopolymorpha pittospori]MBE1603509.1 hypothetical protein [Actinopolymorpha pittospori]